MSQQINKNLTIFEQMRDVVKAGDLDGFVRLLEDGYPVNHRNSADSTLLHAVADSRHFCAPDMARILLDRGVMIDAINKNSETPLMTAIGIGSVRMVKLLLSSGANVGEDSHIASPVWPPLRHAVEAGTSEEASREITMLLLRAGAGPSRAR